MALFCRRLSTCSSSSAKKQKSSNYWHILRSHSSPPSLETSLSRSIPIPNPSLISSTLSSTPSSSLLLSLRLFVWTALHPRLRLSPSLFSLASSSLALPSTGPRLFPLLLDSYAADSVPVSCKTFTVLLTLCLHASLPFDPLALSLLSRMRQPPFSCSPDVPFFNALLRLPSAPPSFVLQEIKSSGLRPDISTYVILVKKLDLSAARNLVATMETDSGCSPSVVVRSALLDKACSCGDLNAALEIFGEMQNPNVVSYTCLMKCLCENGKLEEALTLLEQMGKDGCKPNRVTLKTLMTGLCQKGRVDDAYRIIERVVVTGKTEGGGFSSNECYSLLVVCLLRVGDYEAAENLLGRMLERGIRPDGLALNSVMRVICERRRFLDGYNWIIGVVEEKGGMGYCAFDKDVYSCVLAGLCEEGHFVEAVKLGGRVVKNGVRVEDSCVDPVVDVMKRIGEGELAMQIMRMKDENKSQMY